MVVAHGDEDVIAIPFRGPVLQRVDARADGHHGALAGQGHGAVGEPRLLDYGVDLILAEDEGVRIGIFRGMQNTGMVSGCAVAGGERMMRRR